MKHFIIRMKWTSPIFWISKWLFVQCRSASVSLGSWRPLFVLITYSYHLLNYFLFIIFSCSSGSGLAWPGTLCVDHADAQLTEIDLPLPLGCWHQRHEPPCPCFLCPEEDWQQRSPIHFSLSFNVHSLVNSTP